MKIRLTRAVVCELLTYDPGNGILRWKKRSSRWFMSKRICASWNARFAGKLAFCRVDSNSGRLSGTMLGGTYYAHRIIWLYMVGKWPRPEIDHEDHNAGNNRWQNLRQVTHKENHKNKPRRVDNTSGVTGVVTTATGKFRAQIGVDGKIKYLGQFRTIEAATSARKRAERQNGFHHKHGEAAL